MTTPSTSIVIFGASGDLTRRKLIPALFRQWRKGRLPDEFRVVGFAWTRWDSERFRSEMTNGLNEFVDDDFEAGACAEFVERLHYVQGSFTDAGNFGRLSQALTRLENGDAHRLYYLATPPRFFLDIAQQLHTANMTQETDALWRRVVVEKPFGNSLESAQALNKDLHAVLKEHQIYRIDHYLAKETVQNILVFRFANAIFEPLWNRNMIDHVQITAVESVDVDRRAGYYDKAGVLRDMFQNHLMQLLALVAMEPPAAFDADAVRDEKSKVLRAVRPIPPTKIASRSVRAQYEGYRDAEGVADESETPTYVALELYIDNWRWRGVPFYLRSGKALNKKSTEIIIQFRSTPHNMFPIPDTHSIRRNVLAICIQPHEAIHLRFETKVPDTDADMRSVEMEFEYDEAFGEDALPEAYEKLLLEALEGDATLFTRSDTIESAWKVIDSVIQAWADPTLAPPMDEYKRGSWGPKSADLLLSHQSRHWRHACAEH
ncbi:MAG: glucose-6-phosphate dehydrogenase [Candidatus Promineifilaceae bacterium]